MVARGMIAIGVLTLVGCIVGVAMPSVSAEASKVRQYSNFREVLQDIRLPEIKNPGWLEEQLAAAEATAQSSRSSGITRTVTYTVMTQGTITANFGEFKALANQTLNDSRGWPRLGAAFQEVTTGGDFTLVLASADQLPVFSSGCSVDYSCRVGRYVIINQDRWLGATTQWNGAGGGLRDYRHMVVNHETGHWLGHGHLDTNPYCAGTGQPAPVMQSQSANLQGCRFNPWPLDSELWSTQLGISR